MHTFLFQEGEWEAEGTYWNEFGDPSPLKGKTVITHTRERWHNQGTMRVLGTPPVTLHNDYTILPFPEDELQTQWTSKNPALGDLHGQFLLVGDAIISSYRSADQRYYGTEFMLQVDARHYENRGVLMVGERLLSAWQVRLQRR